MVSFFDELVITDDNREAFDAVLKITQTSDEPTRLFIYGPEGSGKSSLLRARAHERDLLSKKRVMSTHVGEILAILDSGVDDGFLDRVGSVDVLLVDGLEALAAGDERATQMMRLLLTARKRAGLDTVLASDVPPEALGVLTDDAAFEGFSCLEVHSLDSEGRLQLAKRIAYGSKPEGEESLSAAVVEYIARDFANTPDDVRHALAYLTSEIPENERASLSVQRVSELLSPQ